jgi:hypothetical protein
VVDHQQFVEQIWAMLPKEQWPVTSDQWPVN